MPINHGALAPWLIGYFVAGKILAAGVCTNAAMPFSRRKMKSAGVMPMR